MRFGHSCPVASPLGIFRVFGGLECPQARDIGRPKKPGLSRWMLSLSTWLSRRAPPPPHCRTPWLSPGTAVWRPAAQCLGLSARGWGWGTCWAAGLLGRSPQSAQVNQEGCLPYLETQISDNIYQGPEA